ncbi:MAG TPA: hypothetical protein VHM24_04385 [Gemmatimonadaceae bacterium]|nr:hypothetical protein [Gemmatimonadaceae bacterium]
MLLSGAENTTRAAVVLPSLPDSVLAAMPSFSLDSLARLPVDLFGLTGLVGSATLAVTSQVPDTEGCVSWPAAVVSPAPPHPWRFGLRKGVAVALSLDSLEGMSSADSSIVTSEIARVASAVAEGSDQAFQGLPFFVRRAFRFSLGNNSVLVGDVVRKINQEANPREEHLLLVAERSASIKGKYVAAFQSRVAGSEDVVRTNEVLGAVRFASGRPAIVLTFEYENGGKVALLERTAEKQWKLTWRSAYTGC